MNDPPRTPDDPDAPRALARLVRSARADEPTEAELAALTAALHARLGSPPSGGGGAPLRPRARWLTRALPAAAIVGTAALLLARAERPAPAPRTPVVAPVPVGPLPPPTTPAPTPPAPSTAPAPSPLPPRVAPVAAPAPPVCDPADHLRAVESARRALREGTPRTSLTTVARDRLRCPRGPLAEERDRVEIESLLALNRRPEAERRLAQFAREHPGSLHLLQLRARMDSGIESAVHTPP